MHVKDRINYITNWIKEYCDSLGSNNKDSLVIGISGGIDSAVASTLAAKTNFKTIAVSIPIRQNEKQHDLSLKHLEWLKNNYDNVVTKIINLDEVFSSFYKTMENFKDERAFANSWFVLCFSAVAMQNRGLTKHMVVVLCTSCGLTKHMSVALCYRHIVSVGQQSTCHPYGIFEFTNIIRNF